MRNIAVTRHESSPAIAMRPKDCMALLSCEISAP